MPVRPFSSALLAKSLKLPRRLLLRDYIQKSLYDPTHGYFSNESSPVLRHESPPRFSTLQNRSEYQEAVAKTYASRVHGWMTPVELFSPYLSQAFANRLRSVAPRTGRVNVIEIGAGRGTLARDILSYWQATDEDLLSRVSYVVVEISRAMAHLQRQSLTPWTKKGVAHVVEADAMEFFASKKFPLFEIFDTSHCHVLGTEVLDNLPHDLVRECKEGLELAEIVHYESGEPHGNSITMDWSSDIDDETLSALSTYRILDFVVPVATAENRRLSLTQQLRGKFEELLGAGTRDIWVPTASYKLVRAITASIPHSCITLSDFDFFPGALSGVNGPVVQSVKKGSAIVFDSVQDAPLGSVDIMFPTNFQSLLHGHSVLSAASLSTPSLSTVKYIRRVISQQAFFDEYGREEDKEASTCRDGYNPILQDFANASLLLVDSMRT